MKTIILYVATLLIAGGLWSFQKEAVRPGTSSTGAARSIPAVDQPVDHMMTIKHQVTILQAQETDVCGTYLVVITNREGTPVAPPQVYSPDVTEYTFLEFTNAPRAVRMARLVLKNDQEFYCLRVMYSLPDIKSLYLQDGKTVFYKIKPSIGSPKSTN